jgi:glycosyltransferase involved in cell wall biosynthesis
VEFSQARKTISVVTPCFNEVNNVAECHRALKRVFDEQLADFDLEHVFADNASTDGTVDELRTLAKHDPAVKVILNARNFGPFRSTFNALRATSGDAVVILFAADLQDPAEVIPEMVRAWSKGSEIVYGIRANREESFLMRGIRSMYYRAVSRLASISIPLDVGEFQLVDRVVVDVLRQVDDYYPYIRGLIANCGFTAVGVPYTWKRRARGVSKNRLHHLIDQGLNGLISFTNLPMRVAMTIGVGIALAAILYALFTLVINAVYFRQLAPPGIPTLITSMFFLSGVQLLFLGILGEYVAAVHFQVRKRPMVIEKERLNFVQAPSESPEHRAPDAGPSATGRK